MKRARWILLQIGAVCSLVCIVARVLDWYNPYMNFSGNIGFIQMVLYVLVIILAVTTERKAKRERKGK